MKSKCNHNWVFEGGRTCPKYEYANCSQSVLVCTKCGTYDYGEPGGPSHTECFVDCKKDFKKEIEQGWLDEYLYLSH